MSGDGKMQENQGQSASQPIFLLPGIVTALCGLMVALHVVIGLLAPQWRLELTLWLAFMPLRLTAGFAEPAFWVPLIWTPFTHAFLHAGWEHLIINVLWLAIFGTPVARRYGTRPMLVIFLVTAAAGALAFTATSLHDSSFLVGASGGVAGLTGAAVRFVFQPVVVARDSETGEAVPLGRRLASVAEVWANPRARWFSLVWVALNAAVPLLPMLTGESIAIAWQAHLGGFIAGFFLVALFERRS